MSEISLKHSLEQSLASTDFDPGELELADADTSARCAVTNTQGGWATDPEAPAMVSVGLNSADLSCIYLTIDPAGEAAQAQEIEELHLTHSVWLDLRPAEALELGRRLQICAEAAVRFAGALPEEADGAEGADELVVGP
jgi:hypothetical protein